MYKANKISQTVVQYSSPYAFKLASSCSLAKPSWPIIKFIKTTTNLHSYQVIIWSRAEIIFRVAVPCDKHERKYRVRNVLWNRTPIHYFASFFAALLDNVWRHSFDAIDCCPNVVCWQWHYCNRGNPGHCTLRVWVGHRPPVHTRLQVSADIQLPCPTHIAFPTGCPSSKVERLHSSSQLLPFWD
jgi:hypothetical protein